MRWLCWLTASSSPTPTGTPPPITMTTASSSFILPRCCAMRPVASGKSTVHTAGGKLSWRHANCYKWIEMRRVFHLGKIKRLKINELIHCTCGLCRFVWRLLVEARLPCVVGSSQSICGKIRRLLTSRVWCVFPRVCWLTKWRFYSHFIFNTKNSEIYDGKASTVEFGLQYFVHIPENEPTSFKFNREIFQK